MVLQFQSGKPFLPLQMNHGRTHKDQETVDLHVIARYKHLQAQTNMYRTAKTHTKEALDVTTELLALNPEYYTIWNFRRKILLEIPEEMRADLPFTQKLLQRYPKSYWLFNHRKWITVKLGNEAQELQLVEKMLNLDARNFHVWDYRRWVVSRLPKTYASIHTELKFTYLKLSQNFSNFSAWHYRTKLIPEISLVCPCDNTSNLKCDCLFDSRECRSVLVNEGSQVLIIDLEMVRNAIFTEPNDQSAWIYQRWLLGESTPTLSIERCELISGKIIVLFNSLVRLHESNRVVFKYGNEVVEVHLGDMEVTRVFFIDVPLGAIAAGKFIVSIMEGSISFKNVEWVSPVYILEYKSNLKTITITTQEVAAEKKRGKGLDYVNHLDTSTWETELGYITELNEIDPQETLKWTLLTLVFIHTRLGTVAKALEILDRLKEIDLMRWRYYHDLSANLKITLRLNLCEEETKTIDLSSLSIYVLDLSPYFWCIRIDLSKNKFVVVNVSCLCAVEYLDLSDNMLIDVKGLDKCNELKWVSIANNEFVDTYIERLVINMGPGVQIVV